jgi:hypothetical protein
MRPAPEKLFIAIIAIFVPFALFEPFIQILGTVTRKTCHAEELARSIWVTPAIVHGPRDSSPAGSA